MNIFPARDKIFENASTVFEFRHYEINANDGTMEIEMYQKLRFLLNIAKKNCNFPKLICIIKFVILWTFQK